MEQVNADKQTAALGRIIVQPRPDDKWWQVPVRYSSGGAEARITARRGRGDARC